MNRIVIVTLLSVACRESPKEQRPAAVSCHQEIVRQDQDWIQSKFRMTCEGKAMLHVDWESEFRKDGKIDALLRCSDTPTLIMAYPEDRVTRTHSKITQDGRSVECDGDLLR